MLMYESIEVSSWNESQGIVGIGLAYRWRNDRGHLLEVGVGYVLGVELGQYYDMYWELDSGIINALR